MHARSFVTRSLLFAVLCVSISTLAQAPARPADLQATFERAAAAMQAGDYVEAERGFKSVLQADPHNFAALGNLGVLYARTRRFAEAIAVDQKALAASPDNAGMLRNLGLAYLKQEDYPRAQSYLQRLVDHSPGDTQATLLLATAMVLGSAPADGLKLLTAGAPESSNSSALDFEPDA